MVLLFALALVPSATVAEERRGPDLFPVKRIERGMRGYGLATLSGVEPTRFGIKVLGVQRDAVAPEHDLVLVKMTTAARRRMPGFYAGISGAPIYIKGRLLGAAAYGFCCGDTRFVGGVTPARDMLQAFERPQPQDDAGRIRLSPDLARAAGADNGYMEPLTTPLAVAGVTRQRLTQLEERFERFGLALSAVQGDMTPFRSYGIRPGRPYAAVLSYGDFTAAAVGTSTMRIGNKVLAFGHPFTWYGKVRYGLAGARVITVLRDNVLTPFVLAEVGRPVGTVTQDRLAAVGGILGNEMPETSLSTRLRNVELERVHRTNSELAQTFVYLPDVSVSALMAAFDATFDRLGPGSAELKLVVSGTRESGAPFRYVREDVFDSEWDVSGDAAFRMWGDLTAIHGNEFEHVRVDEIVVVGSLSDRRRNATVQEVAVTTPSMPEPVTSGMISAAPGETLTIDVTLRRAFGDAGTRQLNLTLPETEGVYTLVVKGGAGYMWDGDVPSTQPASFDELLTDLAAVPHNRDLIAQLEMMELDAPVVVGRQVQQLRRTISGMFTFEVYVGGVEPPIEPPME